MTAAATRITLASHDEQPGGLLRDAMHRLVRNHGAMTGFGIVAVFTLAAVLAPVLSRQSPYQGALFHQLEGPSFAHVMGTDLLGRDEFARVVYGARLSLAISVCSVAMGLILGVPLGVLSAIGGRLADSIVMRIVDVLLSLPGILMAIAIVAWLGQGLWQIMFAVAVTNAPSFARILRASLLDIRNADFVVAARASGVGPVRVVVRHLLPNSLTPLIVTATLAMATAIISVAGLGFLGLGLPNPSTPELGAMLTDSAQFLYSAPYLLLFPGLAISLLVIGFNLLGDGLREALDPRLRR